MRSTCQHDQLSSSRTTALPPITFGIIRNEFTDCSLQTSNTPHDPPIQLIYVRTAAPKRPTSLHILSITAELFHEGLIFEVAVRIYLNIRQHVLHLQRGRQQC
jgi:hypothetical protein